MPNCVGVAFKRVARSYWYDPNGFQLQEQDRVVVETAQGYEIGTVKIGEMSIPETDLSSPLKRVVRLAETDDYAQEHENREMAKSAVRICKEKVKALELEMKVLQAEYTFDGTQVTIYFTAEGRIDFRELVRITASELHCKVMFYQVGARDQAKMLGGIGPCGLTLCCASFLTDFAPVSMKMAKDQSLFLNPVKFSGVCGKLMCCLKYEHDTYVDAKQRLPQIGELVMTPHGQGKVIDLNLLKETALVQISESGAEVEFPAIELKIEKTSKCSDCRGCEVSRLKEEAAETALNEEE
jgi:cell fate regulator YaaT (PSP1 superfamily)